MTFSTTISLQRAALALGLAALPLALATAGVPRVSAQDRGPSPADRVTDADGVVVDARDGRPIRGAHVLSESGTVLATTDESGAFAATEAPRRIVASGFVAHEIDAWTAASGAELVVRLEPAARMNVVIYEASGGVLQGAQVELRVDEAATGALDGPSSDTRGSWVANTDASGRCRFDALPKIRPLRASVRFEGRLLREIEWEIRLDREAHNRVGWIVDSGRDRVGVVVDERGDPLADVHLWLIENQDDPFHRRRPRLLGEGVDDPPLRVAVTDDRGRFRLPDLPHAWYRIGPAPGSDLVASATALEHELDGEGGRIRLQLDRGHALRGVVRGSDGAPLSEATVFVEQGGVDGALGLRTDRRGRFRLHVPTSGVFRIHARDDRFGFETQPEPLAPGTTHVELRFE